MPINFLKISATGNDFILIDNRDGRLQAVRDAAFFSRICRRRRSVGADGVILLESSKEADFRYVHINADGSIAEMCGNGSRAIVHFAARLGIIDKTARFEINGNIYHAVVDGNRITTEFIPPGPYRLDVDIITEDGYTAGGLIDTGVPHFVIFVEDVQGAEVERLGRKYRHHAFFPTGANIDFVQLIGGFPPSGGAHRDAALPDGAHLFVRTYERGVEAETLACGTGAVASALISHLKYGMPSPALVSFPGGELEVTFDAAVKKIKLTGEVTPVYEGQLLS